MDKNLRKFEDVALLGCDAVRDFLLSDGGDKQLLNRAKAGAAAMGAYTRLRATQANEKAIAITARRAALELPSGEPD